MLSRLIIFGILAALLFTAPLAAQEIDFRVTLLNENVQVFLLDDFDLMGSGTSSSQLFALSIKNLSAQQAVTCYIDLQIVSQNVGVLATGRTNTFTLEALETIQLTNQEFFAKSGRIKLEQREILPAGEDLIRDTLDSRGLPSDIYTFEFDVFKVTPEMPDGEKMSQDIVELNVTNPSTLDLISPGRSADDEELQMLYTTYPFFRWQASNIPLFRLVIAEKLAEVHTGASPDQVISDQVRFHKLLGFASDPPSDVDPAPDGYEILITTSFEYPAAGAWSLQPGKTYYWQIHGIVQSSGVPIELPSEIWAFQIYDNMSGTSSPEQQQLMEQLGDALGEMEGLLNPGGELSGFTPSGVVMINGQPVSMEIVLDILTKIRNGELEAVEVTVE